MSYAALVRLAGLAAIIAGVFRTGAALFPAPEPSVAQEWLYLAVDVLLLFGLCGVFAYQHVEGGIWGFVGFLLSAIGLEVIGGPDGKLGDVDVYMTGTSLIGIGIVFLAIGTWNARRLPRYVATLWMLSTAIGSISFISPGTVVPFMISGVAFGIAFIGAGIRLWSEPSRTRT